MLGEHGQRVLGHVGEAVVEGEADRPRRQLTGLEQPERLDQVDDAVALRGEVLHLLAEAARREGESVVVVVGDAVVQEDPQPARVRAPARAREPAAERPRVTAALTG